MATAALVKANPKPLNLKQSLPTPSPHLRFPSNNRLSFITQTTTLNAVKLSRSSSIGGVKCFSWNQPPPEKYHSSLKYKETPANPNPLQFVADMISKALKLSAIAAVLFGALLMYDPNSALAASAGRMGGTSFSSYESSSRNHSSGSSSRRYSPAPYSPTPAPYSPTPAPYSPTPPPPPPCYSHTPPRVSQDSDSYFSAPNSHTHTSTEDGVPGTGFGYTLGAVIIMGFFIWFAACLLKFLLEESWKKVEEPIWFVAYLLECLLEESCKKVKECFVIKECSVIKLQFGLLGTARSLQKNLNEIAGRSDTSTQKGLHNILEETILTLLRHSTYFISGYSSVNIKRGPESTEILFNELSIEERGKVDEETLVNVNNVRHQSTQGERESGFSNEYIVISIIVAAKGVHKLPTINGSADLKEALQKLGSIPSNKTLAVEVLWTPQQENDKLSEQEVAENYPLLRPF